MSYLDNEYLSDYYDGIGNYYDLDDEGNSLIKETEEKTMVKTFNKKIRFEEAEIKAILDRKIPMDEEIIDMKMSRYGVTVTTRPKGGE